ncbi:hypothetical protein PRK78_005568 [Emydomyces testavorans]|uniref:Uncharacterized protein n=1 Tax=Emydomyces testavorans TaxID=2070801 RepID=A0AAF0DJT3_9EURO|nr:hypothetical protein PRK78_005568 [Emydomyces testavorans]
MKTGLKNTVLKKMRKGVNTSKVQPFPQSVNAIVSAAYHIKCGNPTTGRMIKISETTLFQRQGENEEDWRGDEESNVYRYYSDKSQRPRTIPNQSYNEAES